MNKILVVIPYCSAGAQGRELEYAVAGWRKHFKEDYIIVLAGEDNPITETGDDICCVRSKRVPDKPGQYRQHLDYVSCLKKVREAFPDTDGFIFVADDCYCVHDFDLADVKIPKIINTQIIHRSSPNGEWSNDLEKTRSRLLADGYPICNYTTHLPQWYEWDKLAAIWQRYNMDNESYVFENLYYNIYYGDRLAVNVHTDRQHYKCGVYDPLMDPMEIERAFSERIWITNSAAGWTSTLDAMLSQYYFRSGCWSFKSPLI